MGCRQCLSLSVVQLKGKHCRKPHCCNGVVDTFRPSCLIWYFFWGQVELPKLVHIPILSFHYFVKKLWNSICWTCTPVPFSPTPSPRTTQHSFHLFGFWPMYVPVVESCISWVQRTQFFSKKCVMCWIVVLFVSSIKRKSYSRMHNLSMWYFSMLHKSSFYYPIWMIFNHYAVQSWFKGVKLTFFFGGGHFSGSTLKRSLFRFKRNLNLNYLFIHPFWCNFLSWFTYWIIWLYSFICKSISI